MTKKTPKAKSPTHSKTSAPLLPSKKEAELRANLESLNKGIANVRDDTKLTKESLAALKEFNPDLYREIGQLYRENVRMNCESNLFYNKYQLNKSLIMGFKAYDRGQNVDYFLKIDDVLGLNDDNFLDGELKRSETIEEYLKILEINPDKFFRDIGMDPDGLLLYADDRADNTDKFAIDKIYHVSSPTKLTAQEFARKFEDFKEVFSDEIAATFDAARKLGLDDVPSEYKNLLNLEDKMVSVINSENTIVNSNKARVYISNLIMRARARKYRWLNETIPELQRKKAEVIQTNQEYDTATAKLEELNAKIEKATIEYDAKRAETTALTDKQLANLERIRNLETERGPKKQEGAKVEGDASINPEEDKPQQKPDENEELPPNKTKSNLFQPGNPGGPGRGHKKAK
jgi:hypothetical protein